MHQALHHVDIEKVVVPGVGSLASILALIQMTDAGCFQLWPMGIIAVFIAAANSCGS
ncbi:MAG: hypothetical protein L0H37_11650 [Nitrosospira sp.]|nr:hypothetical protein [Nitrosospira sp.]